MFGFSPDCKQISFFGPACRHYKDSQHQSSQLLNSDPHSVARTSRPLPSPPPTRAVRSPHHPMRDIPLENIVPRRQGHCTLVAPFRRRSPAPLPRALLAVLGGSKASYPLYRNICQCGNRIQRFCRPSLEYCLPELRSICKGCGLQHRLAFLFDLLL
jgi:hypothetical protein